jgi:hypothetical protein
MYDLPQVWQTYEPPGRNQQLILSRFQRDEWESASAGSLHKNNAQYKIVYSRESQLQVDLSYVHLHVPLGLGFVRAVLALEGGFFLAVEPLVVVQGALPHVRVAAQLTREGFT